MTSSFKIKDGLIQLGVNRPFGVNENGVHVFECIRLLCGTVDLEDKANFSTIKLRHCFLTESKRTLRINTIRNIIKTIFDGSMKQSDIENYLNRTSRINEIFWTRVKGELCLALACFYGKRYTQSFLHIYRLLEIFSVAMPIFYAGVEHDYYKRLLFLKSLPQNPRDGDLAILRAFMEVVAKEGGYLGHNIEIYYSKGDNGWDNRFAKQINDYVIVPERLKSNLDVALRRIDVPFKEFPSFFVSFRNRLFHNTLSQDNFDLDALRGSEAVCEPLIKPALNWFTLTLCVVFRQNVARYI